MWTSFFFWQEQVCIKHKICKIKHPQQINKCKLIPQNDEKYPSTEVVTWNMKVNNNLLPVDLLPLTFRQMFINDVQYCQSD